MVKFHPVSFIESVFETRTQTSSDVIFFLPDDYRSEISDKTTFCTTFLYKVFISGPGKIACRTKGRFYSFISAPACGYNKSSLCRLQCNLG